MAEGDGESIGGIIGGGEGRELEDGLYHELYLGLFGPSIVG